MIGLVEGKLYKNDRGCNSNKRVAMVVSCVRGKEHLVL